MEVEVLTERRVVLSPSAVVVSFAPARIRGKIGLLKGAQLEAAAISMRGDIPRAGSLHFQTIAWPIDLVPVAVGDSCFLLR